MPKLSSFALDTDRMEAGVWAHYAGGLYFQISAAGSKFRVVLNRLQRQWIKEHGRDNDADMAPVSRVALAETCVHGWGKDANGKRDVTGKVIDDAEDMLDEDDKPIPFSIAKAKEIARNEAYQDIPAFWAQIANDVDIWKAINGDDAVGNSRSSSSGTSTTASTKSPSAVGRSKVG